ncbi:PREDICTED: ankyrin repeat domain-containing protein 17-like [Branchiostoma belcheri]|uniref:Ankyrin repeat domain-containing protein 17-like n=1 Tax=Branchiostoma belcheri TaxID=7741 RepID=A0A6P4ZQC5_BRABE|nr:PREDICTED: ankyrin repeat domain-containing protein 17-like [Branchiostoma belcheri]
MNLVDLRAASVTRQVLYVARSDMDRREALRDAAKEGDTDRVKQLLAEGVNPNAANSMPLQWTPLHLAAKNGHHETVTALLTADADVNARDDEEWTALHLAALKGHHETVTALLTAAADVNARNDKEWTALHLAAFKGHHETVTALLTAGAEVNARNDKQRTPLHQAAQNGHHKTVSALLVTAGADVNPRNNEQITPLHMAAHKGHHETVSALLTAGADVNAQDDEQKTPLCRAAENDHHETVTVLLTAGAEVNAQRNTFLNLGETNVHHETASILVTVGADLALEGNRESTSHNEESESGQLELPLHGREDTGAGNEHNEMLEDVTAYTDDASSDSDSHNGNGKEEFTDKALRPQKEYDPVLVRFYEERGMTVAKTNCPVIQEAAKESGKTVNQVKNFIGNYRKSKGGSKKRPPPDTMERQRRITGYHEFHREQLPRKRANQGFSLAGANKEIGESWKNLTDEEKDKYNKAAERRRGKETEVKISSEVAKKLKQLEKLSEELGELGVEAFMVTLYNGRIRAFGSQKDLVKDEKFGGYIENQLKAAEHQRKAAQCLATDRSRRSSGRDGTTGTTGEGHDVTGRSGSSTSSVRKRRKKNKEAQQDNQQHRSSAASLPSSSSTQQESAVTTGLLPRTTDIPQNTGTPVHVVLPNRATSTPARPNTGNLELLAQQSATLTDPHNSIPALPHNTGTPVQLAPQATPTESQTDFRYLYRSNIPLERLVPQTTQTAFAVRQVPTGVDNFNSYGLPDRTASLNLPAALPTFQMQGTPVVTTGGLPHTAPQTPTAASLGTSVPSQVTPTVRQAPTGVRTTNEQFPHSPLVFAVPHHR